MEMVDVEEEHNQKMYDYIKSNVGVRTEADFTYTEKNRQYKKTISSYTIVSDYTSLGRLNIDAFKAILVEAPIDVSIDASSLSFLNKQVRFMDV